MKNIYLIIEHYKDGKRVFSEIHGATMDKNFIYFSKFKIKKVDTEEITHEDKTRFVAGLINRCIKIQVNSKKTDERFIPV